MKYYKQRKNIIYQKTIINQLRSVYYRQFITRILKAFLMQLKKIKKLLQISKRKLRNGK